MGISKANTSHVLKVAVETRMWGRSMRGRKIIQTTGPPKQAKGWSIVMIVSWVYTYVKAYINVYINHAQFIAYHTQFIMYQLHLSKAILKNNQLLALLIFSTVFLFQFIEFCSCLHYFLPSTCFGYTVCFSFSRF